MSTIKLEYHQNIDGKMIKKELEFSKYLLKEPYNQDSLFVSMVEGQSMESKINDKALVVADLSNKEFVENGIYLVHKDARMWIKEAKTIENEQFFVSINPNYSHLVYKANESRVIAKALLTFTNL